MNIDERIRLLNKDIVCNQKKIRNLRIRDDIVGFLPSFILVGTITTITFKFCNCEVVQDLYPGAVFVSLIIGGIPSSYLPSEKAKQRIKTYKYNIKEAINELHSIALEENKKYN